MSFPATAWAWRQSGLGAGAKLVLLALAEGASSETGECWHSQAHLARMTSLSRSTVNRHIQELQERRLVEVAERQRPDGSRASNLYRLPPATTLYQNETPPVSKRDTPLSQNATAESGRYEPVSEPSPVSLPTPTLPIEKRATRAHATAEQEAEEWYEAYPRKVDPKGSKKLYVKLRLRGDLPPRERLLDRLAEQRREPGWQDPQFIPHPRTYLNQERWRSIPHAPPPPPSEEEARWVQAPKPGGGYERKLFYGGTVWSREKWEATGREWPEEEAR